MKSYDLVYIMRPDLEPDAAKAVVDRIAQRLQDQGAKVEAVAVWGKRRMSFTIGKNREGMYVHTRLSADPQKVAEIRHQVSLTENILRAVVTTAVGKLPEPAPAAPAVPAAPAASAAPAAPAASGPSQPAEA